IKIKFNSVEEVQEAYDFKNLANFLDIYYENMRVLQYEQDFYDLTWDYLQKIKHENVRHAEIFFDPQAHTNRGIGFDTVVKGIHRALEEGHKQLNITSRLILCFLRDLSEESAIETFQQALSYKD